MFLLADLEYRRDVRVRHEVPHKTTRECACTFRVLYKPGKLHILYGVKEQDRPDAMLSNPGKLKREFHCYVSVKKYG